MGRADNNAYPLLSSQIFVTHFCCLVMKQLKTYQLVYQPLIGGHGHMLTAIGLLIVKRGGKSYHYPSGCMINHTLVHWSSSELVIHSPITSHLTSHYHQ